MLEKPEPAPDRTYLPSTTPAPPRLTGRRRWFGGALLILAALATLLIVRAVRARGSAESAAASATRRVPIPVDAVAARSGVLPHYLSAIGTVVPFNTVTIKSRVDGQIMRVDFKEGQMVQAGQLLIEIDPRPYQVQLEQAQGQMKKDRAALAEARLDQERYRTLLQSDVIARQQFDLQRSTAQQDRGTVKADQAAIDSANLQLTYSRITAPISGRIGLRLVDPGNIVHATDTTGLAVITQLQPIAVIFPIAEDNLGLVMKAMRTGPLPAVAFDRDFKTKLAEGSLLTLDNQIDTSTGTVKLKARFANEDAALFPNQFVNIQLLTETLQDQVLIPLAALQRSSRGAFVYVVKTDRTVEVRTVVPGLAQGDTTAITSGLHPGELVVTTGVDRLQPGSLVMLHTAPAPNAASARP